MQQKLIASSPNDDSDKINSLISQTVPLKRL